MGSASWQERGGARLGRREARERRRTRWGPVPAPPWPQGRAGSQRCAAQSEAQVVALLRGEHRVDAAQETEDAPDSVWSVVHARVSRAGTVPPCFLLIPGLRVAKVRQEPKEN